MVRIRAELVRSLLPVRGKDTHKGSFGRVLVFSGSEEYRGAPLLVTEAAVRMGAGMVHLISQSAVTANAVRRLPELLLSDAPPIGAWDTDTLAHHLALCDGAQALVVGPGSGVSEGLYRFVCALLSREGCPLVLDADALGALALYREEAKERLRLARRPVALTPHPLELARLLGIKTAEVQAERARIALTFAEESGTALLLKGSGTLVTDGVRLLINETGSSALAKGGSGDVLSGAVGALLAQGKSTLDALACAAYLHGRAGDELEKELSAYGVMPSDLPKQMARELAKLLKEGENDRF